MNTTTRRRLLRPRLRSRAPETTQTEHVAPTPRPSAFVSQRLLRRLNTPFDLAVALALFAITTVGNTWLFGIDPLRLLDLPYWFTPAMRRALQWSALMQVVVQLAQWANAHNKRSWRYRIPLEASVIPNCGTYVPIALYLLVRPPDWGALYWPVAVVVALVVVVAVHGVDMYQEVIVVRHT